MRVLWFSTVPSLFLQHGVLHNAGGWISSLQKVVMSHSDITLGLAFPYNNDDNFCYNIDNVSYYPIDINKSLFRSLLWGRNINMDKFLFIINDFKPDLIQIFGSENGFGEICKEIKIPVVIHIQGSIPPYYNALFPIDVNSYDFLFSRGLSLKERYIGLRSKPSFRKRAVREISILKNCSFFMGRTEWDNNLIKLFNPKATYYHCEEMLRSRFVLSDFKWKFKESHEKTIISVISSPWYKGVDLILKTAYLLSRHANLNFTWLIFGTNKISFYEKKYKIYAHDVNVKIMGIASEEELISALMSADCYVHPSYIDNSPNSICEAQIIGVPVVATNVGGVSTILKNGDAGILVPANDPFTMAIKIVDVLHNRKYAEEISTRSQALARKRHDENEIYSNLLNIYNDIIRKSKTKS